ncbi:MAG: RimK family alpha-L-glutamate ligase [Candidatus Methylacidiphilales bacterium]
MKLAILSREPRNYSTTRLCEAARRRGHDVRVFNTLQFGIHIESGSPSLTYRGTAVEHYDAVIPRIGSSITFFGTAVVRQFEQSGVFSLNPSHAILTSRDKLRTLQNLCRRDVGVPETAFVRSRREILPAIERVGGAPVIIKLLEGTQGIGVILAETTKVAEAIIETLQSTRQNVLIQKFVAESKGKDLRAFVIGDQVVAAMRRSAVGTEFRSNVHRGGTTEAVELSEEYQRAAVRATHILGLRVAGVDMLEGSQGPQIMEVNSSPGLRGIEAACHVDLAELVIRYLEDRIDFEDVDIRQRLTLARGYAVAELIVSPHAVLAHKTLAETSLREWDIAVLSINRNGQIIPNPRGDRELLPGDVLLCYGRQDALRNFLPETLAERRKSGRPTKENASST